jgi:hypothetical protein
MTDELGDSAGQSHEMGPIDYVVMEFSGNRLPGEAFRPLLDLVDRGVIRILDLVFVRNEAGGGTRVLTPRDLDSDGRLDLGVFEGASSGLLDEEDIAEVGQLIQPGSSAGVLVYENLWAAPLAGALRRSGGQLVAGGRIPLETVLETLDAVDAAADN